MVDQCRKCGEVLNDANWYPSFRGRHWICNTCWNEVQRQYREKHPRIGRAATAKQKLKVKRLALEKAGGLICVNCGCDDIRALELNHKNGGGNKEKRAIRLSGSRFYAAIAAGRRSTDDIDVRCRVCNALYDTVIRLGVKGHIVEWNRSNDGPNLKPD